jgi:hypothetical protein
LLIGISVIYLSNITSVKLEFDDVKLQSLPMAYEAETWPVFPTAYEAEIKILDRSSTTW